jgi:hypothetical protein
MVAIWARFNVAEPALDTWAANLSRMSYQKLLEYPLEGARPEQVSRSHVEWTLNREILAGGRLQMVVQAYRPGKQILFLKFGEMLVLQRTW